MSSLPELRLSAEAKDFIADAHIDELLKTSAPSTTRVREIVAKSLNKEALTLDETATLLRADEPDQIEEIFEAARTLKRNVYGNRIVLFAPLYIGSECVNDCSYCAFRCSNPDAVRRKLSDQEIREQIEALENVGHKRLILVWGEHPKYDAEYMAHCVNIAYEIKCGHGEIRRVNINAAPLGEEGYRIVKAAGIGTYQIFQETYHRPTYAQCHPPKTRKGDYDWRLDSLDRAMKAGIDDVGIGALFGLYDWRYEVLGLVAHALHLQSRFGVGCHTISFPRLCPASNVKIDNKWLVSDDDFKRLIAILRLAVPYTGLILTARENANVRRDVMTFGVSQIDAGSRIEVGGYTLQGDAQVMEREQFSLGDTRSLDEVIRELLENGYIPSACTACYRVGRTGEHFMEFAIPGFIKRFCTPNALTTLQEYLTDYATPETRTLGLKVITDELNKMPDGELKAGLEDRLHRIRTGDERDLFV